MIGKLAQQEIDQKANVIEDLAKRIWENPELAYHEVKASEWTAQVLKDEGFEVETGYVGLPTAIKATWGSGKPVIGFLGEYDALPGLSQKVDPTKKDPIVEGGPGHGCGHNLLGAAHVGAVIGIKKEMEEKKLSGTIIFYGCPAEELLTGKTFMARGGAFKELDMAFAWHPGADNQLTNGAMTALNSAKFHFKGKTAHAGADPQNGRSALDSAEIMSVGANYLREHVTDDVRIHYVYTDAGTAPNIVPDTATVWYYVRALTRDAVVDTYDRLVNVAKGAALMNGTQVEVEFLGGCYNTLQNNVVLNLLHDTMEELGPQDWSQEDIEFAEKFNANSATYPKLVESGAVEKGVQLANTIPPIVTVNSFGSTDVGDVTHITPAVIFMTAAAPLGSVFHHWLNTASMGHDVGMRGMLYASKVMATSALKAIEDPSIIEAAQAEFKKSTNGKEYVCPIPADVPIPGVE